MLQEVMRADATDRVVGQGQAAPTDALERIGLEQVVVVQSRWRCRSSDSKASTTKSGRWVGVKTENRMAAAEEERVAHSAERDDAARGLERLSGTGIELQHVQRGGGNEPASR